MKIVTVSSNNIPGKVNYRKLVEDLGKQYPGVEIDLSEAEGRTITPVDENGKELPPVFHPGLIKLFVDDKIDADNLKTFVEKVNYDKTDQEERELVQAEKLFDTLLKSPRFQALINSKEKPTPKVEEIIR